jgi:hypothetical protein
MKAVTSSTEHRSPAAKPLQPRPRMLVVLSIVFVLWVAFLLTMYFTTVYPHRQIEARPSATAQALALTRS